MLSVALLTPDRGAYLTEQVAASREDYYAGRGESPGRWFGSAAAALGLAGEVAEGSLERLIDGCHPATGERLRRAVRARTIRVPSLDRETGASIRLERRLEPVGGFDLVFSAPKSVSLAAMVADSATRRELMAAHRAAVEAALGLLEREACGVRLGAGGAERAPASGVVAALYVHRLSRARDPQLHTHCAVANMTQGPDGRWRTLDSRLLLREWKLTLGYAYQAALRQEILQRLGWTWNEPANGLAELAAWPAAALREFSQRRQRIEQAIADHGVTGWRGGQIATLATRERKETGSVDLADERGIWRTRLAEHGMGHAQLVSALGRGGALGEAPAARELVAIAEQLAGPKGLTERDNTFGRADVLRGFAGALAAGTSVEHLEALTDWFLAQPTFAIRLDGDRSTTPGLLECEQRLLDLVERGRNSRTAVVPTRTVERAIAGATVALSDEQAQAVRDLTTSGHAIENLEALAGTGKTTVCGVTARAYVDAGYLVIGATPAARAARELQSAGVEATTIDAILTRLDHRPTRAPEDLVVLADECGMAGTRQLAALHAWARQSRAKIIQIGDSRQLAAVPAAGIFAAITERYGAARLSDVRRQRDPREVEALADLRVGVAEPYVRHQIRAGGLRFAGDAQAGVRAGAAWWLATAGEHGAHRLALVSRDNDLRAALNAEVQTLRRVRGELAGPVLDVAGRAFQRGDRVICRHNDRRLDVDNGTRGTVAAVDPHVHAVYLQTDDARRVRLPRGYLDAGHLEHAYALTAYSLQGATVETACVVSRPDDHASRWTYTASSRARGRTQHIVIDDDPERDVVARLLEAMGRDDCDELAIAVERVDVQALERTRAATPWIDLCRERDAGLEL